MEKTISKEQYNQIKIGDKIRLISIKPVNSDAVRCGWCDEMDGMLGKVFTVKNMRVEGRATCDKKDTTSLIVEYQDDNYYISADMITEVNPKERKDLFTESLNAILARMVADLTEGEKKMKFTKVIDKVIYNKPATIILWADGTKTTAKCADNEPFDPEKGLILCAFKRFVRTEDVMELLDFVKTDGNGTVTYKDVLNKGREKKKAKNKIITVDVGNKSMTEVKEELKAIREVEEKKSKKKLKNSFIK